MKAAEIMGRGWENSAESEKREESNGHTVNSYVLGDRYPIKRRIICIPIYLYLHLFWFVAIIYIYFYFYYSFGKIYITKHEFTNFTYLK